MGQPGQMRQPARYRILAVMGSGETSPTMVTVHRKLVSRLAAKHPRAVLLETPYAFQENAADVSARARSYFARSVGLEVSVLGSEAAAGDAAGQGSELAALRAADWVFSGPGSPSYALERWRTDGIAQALRDRVAAGGGITVMASAAAATIGSATLPVYEIYKAGAAPHWLDGLDLLGLLGLRVALIPHYDNTEGGTHDTRYCYLGERRLSRLEHELPHGVAVLGVDEHTAIIFDLNSGRVEVTGRGCVTVRRAGESARESTEESTEESTVLPHGTVLSLTELRELARNGPAARSPSASRDSHRAAEGIPQAGGDAPVTLTEITRVLAGRFDAASAARDAPAMVDAILDLETAIGDWASDTEEDLGTRQARAVLRSLISRLGGHAARAADDPRQRLAAAVDPLVELRAVLRGQGMYPAADIIRDALAAAGLYVQDTAEGTRWTPADD
jgi:cyanophycinase-like exopeptidase